MKIALTLSALLILVLGCKTKSKYDLTGTWNGYGYYCFTGEPIQESIKVTQKDDSVFAIKIKGDDCVGDGELTWKGKIINDTIVGVMAGLVPPNWEKVFVQMNFRIVSNDSIIVNPSPTVKLSFSRVKK
jgi:hypothetical protein